MRLDDENLEDIELAMWNDPDEEVNDWEENERGCGYIFGHR